MIHGGNVWAGGDPADWLDYSANGQVNGKKPTSSQATTFAAQYLASGVDPAMRPLVTLEPDMGLSIFVR